MASQTPSPNNLLQTIASALSAAFGVQSSKNLQRDFTTGSAKQFIVIGVIGTILFISTIILVVKMVLSKAGV